MTKIKNYVTDLDVTANDKWIGTDSSNNYTKNFTPSGIASFFNSNEVINVVGSVRFFYDTVDPLDDRASGSFSFPSEIGPSVDYSDITDLVFSKRNKGGNTVVEYMQGIVGNIMLIHKANNVNKYAVYRMTSFEQDLVETDFYNCSLEYIGGNGGIEEDEDYLLSLLQVTIDGDDKYYSFVQDIASDTWSITHNLNKYPSVTMVLSTGQKGYGDVTYIDENNLTITFASAESGKAYMN